MASLLSGLLRPVSPSTLALVGIVQLDTGGVESGVDLKGVPEGQMLVRLVELRPLHKTVTFGLPVAANCVQASIMAADARRSTSVQSPTFIGFGGLPAG
jgi:hypothetical protein